METLQTSEQLIKECIRDLYLDPRNLVRKWSKITNQTCQIRFAYPGQHIASVITGIKGRGTAARGDDLSDGSEVKTCSRADQLSGCNSCGAKVLVWQEECPTCKSHDINVKTDSHWIFSIKSEDELNLLLNKVPRIVLILFDKESSETNNIRLRLWVVDPNNKYVQEFFKEYYYNNYLKKENPAPCNLHPLSYDFFLMTPKIIFHAYIRFKERDVDIIFWDVKNPRIEKMPTSLLKPQQIKEIFKSENLTKKEIINKYPFVPELMRDKLIMRVKVTKTYKNKYVRR